MTTTIDTDHLRGIAERGAADLGPDATAAELLRWTAETFGTDFIIAANMQDAVLIDVADNFGPEGRRLARAGLRAALFVRGARPADADRAYALLAAAAALNADLDAAVQA